MLLHLAPAAKEDTASGTASFEDLERRGLADPLLAIADGARGSSGPRRPAFRGRCTSAAWSTGCASPTAWRQTATGRRSRCAPAPIVRRPRRQGAASCKFNIAEH